ncbi:unnamed protein product [Blepharisma stoltei]|uniref:PKD/REJ-like domain-containing protein n=1 Tax=Blepharisma stoltei TaxID=1481888 RepID=A0AAU9JHZ7_9CILI|nr:unnamed protein product [Blepharisma stoltei]
MLIVVSIILQLQTVSGFCHSTCRESDFQNYCINCWSEQKEDFEDQSFCDLWSANMCAMMNKEVPEIENAINDVLEMEPKYTNFKFQWVDIQFLILKFSSEFDPEKNAEIICEWKLCSFNETVLRNICNRKCKSCLSGYYDEFHCEACNLGSYLYQNTCLEYCPEGTIENPITNTCDAVSPRKLSTCSPACGGTCTQSTNGYCSSCAQDYVTDYYNSGLCVQFCEAGLSATNGICPDPSSIYCDYVFTTEVNPINSWTSSTQYQALVSSASPTGSLNNNPSGPYPIYTKGFYFPELGTGYIQLPPNSVSSNAIILGNHFTIAVWVFPKSSTKNQYIFAKEGSDYVSMSLYMSPDQNIHIAYRAFDSTTNAAQQYDDIFTQGSFDAWLLMEIHVDLPNQKLGLYYFGSAWYSLAFTSKFFSDIDTETFSIGKSFINNGGFYGLIFEFLIGWNNLPYDSWSYVYHDYWWVCGCNNHCGGYSTGYSKCIYSCGYTQFYDGYGSCYDCDTDCIYGCTGSGNCNMNLDPLCREWTGFEQSECTKCCDNCNTATNPCSCKSGYINFTEGRDCVLISPKCATSYYVSNGECNTCSAGNHKIYNYGLCLSNCPVTWYFNGSKCKSYFDPYSLIIHYVFNQQTNTVADSVSGFKAYMGSTDIYYPDYDNNDPIPVYQQGLYFSGNSYVYLPPNPADDTDFILGDYFTIMFWVRPFSTGDNSYILSKEGTGYTRLALYFTPDMHLEIKFIGFNGVSLATKTYTLSSPNTGNWNSWLYVGFRAGMEDANSLYMEITIDEVNGGDKNMDYTFYEDFPGEKFSIGRNINENKYFRGFIYEMQIYNNFNEYPNPAQAVNCGCRGCGNIEFTDCLMSCDYNQFYDFDSEKCKNCDEKCKFSCMGSGNCNLNFDPMCSIATGFNTEDCITCVDGAIGAGDKCTCDYRHELSGITCKACYYHIQDRNVISYFSEDYQTVVIEFDQAVSFSMPSTCNSLFSSNSLAVFGESPNCYWSSDRMSLYVNLGENARIVENSQIVFNKGVLMTDLNACGGPIGTVSVKVSYKYPKPIIYPEASLIVPYQLYILCDDLIIDATKSKGGYRRPLTFSWSFDSSPLINTLSKNSKYLTQNSYISIEKADLSETAGNITLTLINWLGFSTSLSKPVNIINSNGLFLYYDFGISLKLKTSEYKSIEVFASSECQTPKSDELHYKWWISNKVGSYVNIDEKVLWDAQTIQSTIYSPPGSFGPGLYTFFLKVSDLLSGLSAMNQFNLTYLPSDLVIDLPANMTLYYPSDLSISSKVIDPDNLPESITYTWNCTINSYNCTSIIKNPTKSVLSVPKSKLKSGAIYIFTLTVNKSSRVSSKAIEVEVINRNKTMVTFSEIPKYVNTKENFVIWAYPNVTGNYSSSWSVIEGGQYKLMNVPNSSTIGFQANSLDSSKTYCAQYTLSDSNGISIYQLYFYTNILPGNGKLEISPSSGFEFSTVFNLTASNFSTPDFKTLEYQFGYYVNGNEIPLNIKNESSFLYTTLQYASPDLTVFVKVYDKQGSYEIFTQNVIVNEYLQLFGDTNNGEIIGFSQLISGINRISKQIIGNSSSSLADLEWARDTNLNSTKLLVNLLYHFDTESFQVITELLSGILTKANENDKITENQREITLALFDTMVEKAKANSIYIKENSLISITNILDFAASLNASTLYENPKLIQHITQILTDLLIEVSKFMPIDYSLNIDSNNIHIDTQLKASDSIKTYKSSIEFGGISLPNDNNYSLPANTTALLYILIIYDNNSTESNDNFPRGFEFLITAITPTHRFSLNIDMSPYNLNIEIPYYEKEVTDPIECVFYKNNKWSTDGCKFISYGYPKVLCQCTHTSLYTAGTSILLWPSSSSTINQWWYPFYYSCGLCGFYYIIVIFLFIVESKNIHGMPLNSYAHNKILPISIQHSTSLENINQIYKISTGYEEHHSLHKNLNEISEQAELESESIKCKESDINNKNLKHLVEADPVLLTSHPENFETITLNNQTISPRNEKRKSWVLNFRYHYFISFIFFTIPEKPRSARFSLFATSLMLQIFLCGIFADFYGSEVSSSENSDFIDVSLGYSQVSFACSAAVMANILILNISLILSPKAAIYSEIVEYPIKTIIRSFAGYTICIFIISINVVATYLIADDVDGNSSKVWMKMILISLGFDSVIVQGVKVLSSLLLTYK